ncbi:glycerophosphoryl diester phosphodiesterase membrane domain-containing protein [Citromicrobium bathyomarinum]|uniref:glycerophosphoryl diester phosphodiesterase membrane domain-containing protein n=1 Tax=unclassified Citromicrobium TaxID=2630544 RepID=UPI0006C8FE71|nr:MULTISPECIES: glycerophosphoryl diester phosphodiesterase membrane domain-containing protein [unclassified Citromicrobium]KPM21629.1 hypothetical protein AAJ72_14925 [Citromicrobium sp. RCC1885]KPM23446.1 hypothetical protein AAJ74_15240 [Citromicrobium sp. RCC1878]OAM07019.1 hypothetical protein A0U43_14015 [Citromicrobium sp. RCC1897]|tara:strand:- start:1194 stop:2018 length:825 start_codon:yes stop_codon:yes gene_type:complete
MKLDMNRAWTEALSLIQANIGVVATVAGVFFFLPYLAFALLMPETANFAVEPNPDDPTAAFDQVMALYADIWWIMLLLIVAQTVGTLALLALLRADNRPTVGQAITVGAIGFLTSIAATIILYIGVGVIGGVLMGVAIASKITALAVILGLLLFVAFIYLMVKFSLLAPVIAIDKVYNPLTALLRSWRLTKGNSVRLFFFYLLLFIALVVVSGVIGMIVMLVFGLMGEEVMLIGSGLINSAVNAVVIVLMLGVLAAVHRQLAGPSAESMGETFE